VCLEPSTPFGDAPCPNCGTLLWFIGMPNQRLLFARRSTSGQRESVIRYLAEQLGVDSTVLEADASLLSKLQTDSLDVVELVMKLEEHFDL